VGIQLAYGDGEAGMWTARAQGVDEVLRDIPGRGSRFLAVLMVASPMEDGRGACVWLGTI